MGLSWIKSYIVPVAPASPKSATPTPTAAQSPSFGDVSGSFVDMSEVTQFPYEWTNIVCEGGGAKCIAMCGAIKVLELAHVMTNITNYAGSSAGSILCMLLAAGYSADELVEVLMRTNFYDLLVANETNVVGRIYKLIESYGCYDGAAYVEWLGSLLRQKGYDPDINFVTLYRATSKTLVITGSNISTGHTEYFSHHTTPLMPVRLAVRISVSIPFVFQPVSYGSNNQMYADGGLFCNFPLDAFDSDIPGDRANKRSEANSATLGLKLIGANDRADKQLYYHKPVVITNIVQFGATMFCRALDEIERLHIDADYWTRTIAIPTDQITTVDFALTRRQKYSLLQNGSLAAATFLRQWVRAHKRRPSFVQRWLRRAGQKVSAETSALDELVNFNAASLFPALVPAISPHGARSPSHCQSASMSMGGTLTKEQLEKLREEFVGGASAIAVHHSSSSSIVAAPQSAGLATIDEKKVVVETSGSGD